MENKNLKKLQAAQLTIAKEIRRVCIEKKITYFLTYGTLLGAVRHSGFIPWDDDMDIGMLRHDYNAFIEAFQEIGNTDKFFLETWDSEEGYPFSFAKLKLNNSLFMENSIKKANVHKGIYVDIFPYDFAPDKKAECLRVGKKLNVLNKMLKFKLGYLPMNPDSKYNYVLATAIRTVGVFIPKKILKNLIYNTEIHWNRIKTGQLACMSSAYYLKDTLPASLFKEFIPHDFCGEEFIIPKAYHEILHGIYGDYMKLPPEEKRITRHFPEIIEFDEGEQKNDKNSTLCQQYG